MSLTSKEMIDLSRLNNLLAEIQNHKDCGGGWLDLEDYTEIKNVILKFKCKLYEQIGYRESMEYLCKDKK